MFSHYDSRSDGILWERNTSIGDSGNILYTGAKGKKKSLKKKEELMGVMWRRSKDLGRRASLYLPAQRGFQLNKFIVIKSIPLNSV